MKIKDSKTARFLATSLTTGLAASTGNAAVVQITLTGNTFATTTGYNLFSDLTGDGTSDITLSGKHSYSHEWAASLGVEVNGVHLSAFAASDSWYSVQAGFSPVTGGLSGRVAKSITAYNLITLMDARINGGAATQAYLEVNARNISMTSQEISLLRLVFDDASPTILKSSATASTAFQEFSAVPEPSGISLLALGAGGLLTRRRRLAA